MKSYCTKGLLLLAVALLLLGTAACTQSKPAVPTPTLQVFQNTPVLPSSVNQTPGAQETAPAAVGTEPAGGPTPEGGLITPSVPGTEPAGPAAPTNIPTPTSSFAAPAPAATQPAPATSGGATTSGGCPNPYTVQRGDWLYQIARNCGVSPQALMAANPGVNPNLLIPGQSLRIPGGGTSGGAPSQPGGRTYTVRPGDTVFSIATRFGTTVAALMQANGLSNPNVLYVGQVLTIP